MPLNFTPGPWYSYQVPWGAKVVDVQDVTVADVPEQPMDTWEAIATARLIAAAPEMYEALLAALQSLRTFSPFVPKDEQQWTSFDEDARALIESALNRVAGGGE